MAESIGIKQADGNFYSILEVDSPARKRLVLATAHEKQKSVQVDLYKSNIRSMADAMYIGTLVIENVTPKAKGTPSIEMTIVLDEDGSVSVDAVDVGNRSNAHHLSISLDSLEDDKMDYPDFDMEGTREENSNDKNRERKKKKTEKTQTRGKSGPVILIIAAALVLVVLGLLFFVVRFRPDLIPQEIKFPSWPKTGAAILEQPAVSIRQAAPQSIPPEGFTYKVRQGDTLWDISEAFYRNPRHYTFIAQSNDISTPAMVVPGTELTIFPKR
jgi:LysM repeat protein